MVLETVGLSNGGRPWTNILWKCYRVITVFHVERRGRAEAERAVSSECIDSGAKVRPRAYDLFPSGSLRPRPSPRPGATFSEGTSAARDGKEIGSVGKDDRCGSLSTTHEPHLSGALGAKITAQESRESTGAAHRASIFCDPRAPADSRARSRGRTECTMRSRPFPRCARCSCFCILTPSPWYPLRVLRPLQSRSRESSMEYF